MHGFTSLLSYGSYHTAEYKLCFIVVFKLHLLLLIILYSTNYRLLSSHDVMVLIFICFVLKHLTNNDLILFETVRVNEFYW